MANEFDASTVQEIKTLLYAFFPDSGSFSLDEQEGEGKSGILYRPEHFLPYLQTVFFEEHLLELQIDRSTRTFFANILDELPELVEYEEDDGIELVEPDYETGSYLKALDSLILTPLTPAIGNALVRGSERVVIRYFSGTTAIEFGCTFQQAEMIREVPVLRFHFPVIGRINKNYRLYRIKTVSTVDAHILIKTGAASAIGKRYQIVDVSAMGLAFQVPSGQPPFQVGETVGLWIQVADLDALEVQGQIRSISKVRENKGYKNICGVRFDLESRSLAAELEKIAATVQRLHLRELAKKTANSHGVHLIR